MALRGGRTGGDQGQREPGGAAPDGAAELTHHGHTVLVQAGAGAGSRFSDEEFAAAGATVLATADEVFAAADLIVKVKEPIPAEYHRFRPGQQLFTYLHLAADQGSPSA